MAKVQIKSDKYRPFGGFFFVANEFKRHIMPHIDEYLGIRCKMKENLKATIVTLLIRAHKMCEGY